MRQWMTALRASRKVAPASSPALRAWAAERVGQGAVEWAAEVTVAVLEALVVRRSSQSGPTEVAGARGCEECTLVALVGLADEGLTIVTPEAALDDARVAARADIALERLLRVAWGCHAEIQERLLTLVQSSVPPAVMMREVRYLVSRLTACIDQYISDISNAYAEEQRETEGRLLAGRRRVVDAVLNGAPAPEGSERVLGLRWTDHHVAAVGWSSAGNRALHTEDNAQRFARQVARAFGGSSLIVERGDHVEFHWSLPRPESFDPGVVRRERPGGMRLALGFVAPGMRGFVASTRAARSARSIGLRMGHPPDVVEYDEVSVLALASSDWGQAGEFVRREIGGLIGDDPGSASIRDTLCQFLISGRSRQVAAAATHVAPTTVAYRVRRAEEMLGRSSTTRVQETILALQLAHAFPELLEERSSPLPA